jgi:uncharacterized protein (DUF433 family)
VQTEYRRNAGAGRGPSRTEQESSDMTQVAGEIYPGIVVDPQIVHGKPVIAGTRIPVSLVLGQLAGGISFEELQREYGPSEEQVRAAIGYAASTHRHTLASW